MVYLLPNLNYLTGCKYGSVSQTLIDDNYRPGSYRFIHQNIIERQNKYERDIKKIDSYRPRLTQRDWRTHCSHLDAAVLQCFDAKRIGCSAPNDWLKMLCNNVVSSVHTILLTAGINGSGCVPCKCQNIARCAIVFYGASTAIDQ